MAEPNIGELLRAAPIDPLEARILLQTALEVSAAYLAAHPEHVVAGARLERYLALVARRTAGEPIAYLTGAREFFSLDFKVTPAVLIPRPETELLVELALERMPQTAPCRVLDLGSGSGCVAIGIAVQRPHATVTASDCSPEALAVAAHNARALGAHNVGFKRGDWFDAVGGERFDLIVSNPPYIAEDDPHLRRGDLRFEPRRALAGGVDGLDCIRRIVAGAKDHLVAGGWLMFEHGHDQAERGRTLLRAAGFVEVFSQRDLAGHERVSGGRKSPPPHEGDA
ncbi:MAG: peptide chain release factor N(5)-glutamine methyltransferase [Burkholderiales bacterium]